jgi:hypothetical protein
LYILKGYTVQASPGTWKAIQVVYPERLYRPALQPGRLYKLQILKGYTGQPWNLEGYTGYTYILEGNTGQLWNVIQACTITLIKRNYNSQKYTDNIIPGKAYTVSQPQPSYLEKYKGEPYILKGGTEYDSRKSTGQPYYLERYMSSHVTWKGI